MAISCRRFGCHLLPVRRLGAPPAYIVQLVIGGFGDAGAAQSSLQSLLLPFRKAVQRASKMAIEFFDCRKKFCYQCSVNANSKSLRSRLRRRLDRLSSCTRFSSKHELLSSWLCLRFMGVEDTRTFLLLDISGIFLATKCLLCQQAKTKRIPTNISTTRNSA